ncbi:uncharacterized protein SPAPADRAFT_138716 [Spathaspora passalidarum NRRL Y-27907]|uniref:Zn(2)-C6 fungal-type domain-containing protein n=1 Tax=Spathaspora passalidarum (strain NRRL Y-27907 / 11-Y1) TaxID=619300 RepID=G3ANQ0_SPAPN|nr:uncharacterized protein SPAPADRAFT_138716 [Spathaspora passalidarum NRRL Y-27907]EGW31985.1 hypothetical protein SPAPADRAFT_138716 [Spathaspora passalidarum NRRL Y-27907]
MRTKVACDYCRKRKSRCDGENPCSKCASKNRPCTYTVITREPRERVRKPKPAAKSSHSPTSIQGLNARLSAMEGLLTKLITRLDSDARPGFTKEFSDLQQGNSEHSFSPEDSNSDEDMDDDNFEENEHAVRNPLVLKELLQPPEKQNCEDCITKGIKRRMMQYFGSHSIFYSFSGKFIAYMKGRIQGKDNDDLFTPLRKIPLAITNAVYETNDLLNEPKPVVDMQAYFDESEQGLIFEILAFYYDKINLANFLCRCSTVRELFQIYFYGRSQRDQDILKDFTSSNYLLMNSALALCLVNVSEKDIFDPIQFPNLAMRSGEDLFNLKTRYFNNAVQMYDKVSKKTMNSVKTVQGLSLLILYVEANFITDFHVNYILASVLIRVAKDSGLHRVESFINEDEEEAMLRRRLWWFCECFGTDITYKSGKPMSLSLEDVSTLTESDPCFLSVPMALFDDDQYLKNSSRILGVSQDLEFGVEYYFAYFTLIFNRIRTRSYRSLYCKHPSAITTSELFSSLKALNNDLRKLSSLMVPEARPVLHYRRETPFSLAQFFETFGANAQKAMYNSFTFQLSFFSHSLSINRVPFQRDFFLDDDRLIPFGNNSLDSARSILHLAVGFNKSTVPKSSLSSAMTYPLVAFSSLLGNCMVLSNAPTTHSDCLLLINVSMNYFAVHEKQRLDYKILDNKMVLCDLLARLLLRVLVATMQTEIGHKYVEEIPGLQQHLTNISDVCPEVFNKANDGQVQPAYTPNGSSSVSSTNIDSVSSGNNTEFTSPESFDIGVKPLLSDLLDTGAGPSKDNYIENIDFNQVNDDAFNFLILNEMNDLPNFFTENDFSLPN